ncbi:ABC transporter related protein [Halothece sp. PCC 7418]|uniref:ABC transporter ATP-binding protein n=1 Tax=Halothece sp. (strain PCC 7418) TaxID=65093 RepID=UPI0002A05D72|nr:ABC transporter ATP-binding protein [Halothece sp. PCC 7418]AFZ45455.1 ABC transporter related protein [Halothece sp. PCC 7418]
MLNQESQQEKQFDSFSTPKLVVDNLSKIFKEKKQTLTVLEKINLHLFPNELVCLVGPSGCGKSTLLNIIAGLVSPTKGSVFIDGEVVFGPGADRGMIFQNYTLYPWLTVAQNIAFGLYLKKMSKFEQKQRVHYYLNIIGLSDFANTYPKDLSGGMKQRVAIARALANEPDVLLMDEPFGALDAQTKEQLQEFLMQLWEQTKITILMVTHDIEEAIFLSQRLYILATQPGRIKREIGINLPINRSLDLKLTPEFIERKRDVLNTLR